jgi:hypothetical protein
MFTDKLQNKVWECQKTTERCDNLKTRNRNVKSEKKMFKMSQTSIQNLVHALESMSSVGEAGEIEKEKLTRLSSRATMDSSKSKAVLHNKKTWPWNETQVF